MKRVRDVMCREVFRVTRDLGVGDAEWLMLAHNLDAVAVHRGPTLVGVLTAHAIAACANRIGTGTTVADVMSRDIDCCCDDQDVDDAARTMARLGVRRLPVVDRGNRLVGSIRLDDALGAIAGNIFRPGMPAGTATAKTRLGIPAPSPASSTRAPGTRRPRRHAAELD